MIFSKIWCKGGTWAVEETVILVVIQVTYSRVVVRCGHSVCLIVTFFDVIPLQCFDTVGWATGRASSLKKTGCWFVGVDDLTGALCDRIAPVVQLSPPPPSSFASINRSANPGSPGKYPLKQERERERDLLTFGI